MIGTLETGHCGANACLHWGAKKGPDDYLNPLRLVRPLIRLLE
jgi:peptidase M23